MELPFYSDHDQATERHYSSHNCIYKNFYAVAKNYKVSWCGRV